MFYDNDLERVAGWNDGNKITVDSNSLSSPVVQSHEAIHGRIFNETADGQLHRTCCKAAGHRIDRDNNGIYTNISKILFLQTRETHEAAATYLAIQGLPSRRLRKQEYQNLTKEYKQYYDLMASLIDPLSKTTWLRYAFCWTFTHWCFSSLRAEVFYGNNIPSIDPFFEIESPSVRFNEACKFLRNGKRSKNWVKTTLDNATLDFAKSGRTIWNINDENAWNRQDIGPNLQLFESMVTTHAGDWLLNNVPIETYDFTDSSKMYGSGFDTLMEEMGLEPIHVFTDTDSVLDASWWVTNVKRLAFIHAEDTIAHAPSCSPIDLTSLKHEDALNFCISAINRANRYVFINSESNDQLILLCRGRVSDVSSNEVNIDDGSFVISKDMAKTLIRHHISNVGGKLFDSVYIMLKTRRDDIINSVNTAIDLCGNLDPEAKKGDPDLLLPSDHLLFYIDGPWTDVYQIQDISVTHLDIGLIDITEEEMKPVSVRLGKISGSTPGYVITIKPSLSGYHLDKYEKLMFDQGVFKELSIEDNDFKSIIVPLGDAWHIWDRF